MTSPLSNAAVQVSKLSRDLHKMGPAGRKSLKSRLTGLGGPLLADARRRANWSTRIPAALSVRPIVDAARGRFGVQLRGSTAQAPHLRAYEGLSNQGNEGYFRHPVHGNEDVWVSQTTRPFAYPAVVAMGDKAQREAAAALEDAAREAGFR